MAHIVNACLCAISINVDIQLKKGVTGQQG